MINKRIMIQRILTFGIVAAMSASVVGLSSCSKKAAAETAAATTAATSATAAATTAAETTAGITAETADPSNPNAINPLTGIQDMDPANIGKRSVSVSINNHPEALPSRGIGSADVIYEFETEGGQTRMLALFADVAKMPEMGSLRSARIIACDLSGGTNSIFIHYGENGRVPEFLTSNHLDDIDGNIYSKGADQSVDGVITLSKGIYFWRDSVWLKSRDLEHTAVTNGANVLRGITDLGITLEGETPSLFAFTSKSSPSLAAGKSCTKLVVYFSTNNDDSTFTYDSATKMYLKSEYGDPQIDETTGQQIAVKNVFTLFANIQPHGDTTIDAYLTEGGIGYYCSEGKLIDIKWTKAGPNDPILVTDMSGKTIQVNAGKSYINVVRKTVTDKTTWS